MLIPTVLFDLINNINKAITIGSYELFENSSNNKGKELLLILLQKSYMIN